MSKLIVKNRKAFFDYEILERFQAGIELRGSEVKSIKNGQINIGDSFVRLEKGNAILWNANIPLYKHSDIKEYDPTRARRLLLHKREIEYLQSKSFASRLTVIPLSVYLQDSRIKIEVGLARGKKYHEKKERQKERDLERELHREKRKYMVE